jgi:hypothetical protein
LSLPPSASRSRFLCAEIYEIAPFTLLFDFRREHMKYKTTPGSVESIDISRTSSLEVERRLHDRNGPLHRLVGLR